MEYVGMEINQSRRNDTAVGMDDMSAFHIFPFRVRDSGITDHNILNLICACIRIHDPPAANYKISFHIIPLNDSHSADDAGQYGAAERHDCTGDEHMLICIPLGSFCNLVTDHHTGGMGHGVKA